MADNPNFTDQDLTIDEYKAFSPTSLFAFLFSLVLSLVAAVNPSLNLITVFAIGVAVFSVYRLIVARGRSTGYVLSAIALCLPLFVFASTWTYRELRLVHLTNAAVQHSETWLRLLQEGKAVEAHELTLTRYEREPEGTDLTVTRGSIESPKKLLEEYLKNQLDRAIMEDGEDAKFTRIGGVGYVKEPKLPVENFYLDYRYKRPNGEERVFRLRLRRQVYNNAGIIWNVLPSSLEPKENRIVG